MADKNSNGNGMQTKLLAALLAALLSLGGLQATNQFGDKQAGDVYDIIEPMSHEIDTIGTVVNRVDAEGIPLVYTPRKLLEVQEQMLETLRSIEVEIRQQNGR